jgi:hypothetical protein
MVIGSVSAAFLVAIHPGPLVVIAALFVVVGCVAAGAWKLWNFHVVLRDTDFSSGLRAVEDAELADECELATFTALQRAEEHLEYVEILIDDGVASVDVTPALEALVRRVDEFVFTGEGFGDLAAAWSLEEACRQLAETADDWRPAA